jgi:hypothetical protein
MWRSSPRCGEATRAGLLDLGTSASPSPLPPEGCRRTRLPGGDLTGRPPAADLGQPLVDPHGLSLEVRVVSTHGDELAPPKVRTRRSTMSEQTKRARREPGDDAFAVPRACRPVPSYRRG